MRQTDGAGHKKKSGKIEDSENVPIACVCARACLCVCVPEAMLAFVPACALVEFVIAKESRTSQTFDDTRCVVTMRAGNDARLGN